MKGKAVTLIVAVNLVAVLLLAILFPHLMISPGKPIDAHAELSTNCYACHTPFIGSSASKCIVCHKVEEIGKITTKGLPVEAEKKNVAFHQKLVKDDCVSCHSDHKGVKAFRPISQFSHNLVESTLQNECGSCHNSPVDDLHRKAEGNCGQCHTQNSWMPATFKHEKYFRFDREHNAKCVTCHINNNYANFTCYGCHEHSRSKIREEHFEEGIRDYENCVRCHRSGDEDEAKTLWRSRRSKETRRDRRKSDHDDGDDRDERDDH